MNLLKQGEPYKAWTTVQNVSGKTLLRGDQLVWPTPLIKLDVYDELSFNKIEGVLKEDILHGQYGLMRVFKLEYKHDVDASNGGRLLTPRGRQWCKDCSPTKPCDKHPFDPKYDRKEEPMKYCEACGQLIELAPAPPFRIESIDHGLPMVVFTGGQPPVTKLVCIRVDENDLAHEAERA